MCAEYVQRLGQGGSIQPWTDTDSLSTRVSKLALRVLRVSDGGLPLRARNPCNLAVSVCLPEAVARPGALGPSQR